MPEPNSNSEKKQEQVPSPVPKPFQKPEMSINEKRIREMTLMYYSRLDVRKAIFEFSKNRECVPRYFEGFGKRPDSFQYDQDIMEQVKRGATSFHSSEEIWEDALEINNEMSRKEFNDLRIGWDLLLDIDSPYLEYSKIYAKLLIDTLKFHGIKNIGVKFSGSKGFHIIIPWNAFPKEVYGVKTKDMFPEWPRIICQYLTDILKPKLEEELLKNTNIKDVAKRTGRTEEEMMVLECNICKRPAIKKDLVTWYCPHCKNRLESLRKNKRIPKCPTETCRKPMEEESFRVIFACDFCNMNSIKNPELFGSVKKIGMMGELVGNITSKERYKTENDIEADLILVAPRHLFRMPYSLHEKTSLASIVIDPDKVKDFQIIEAKPLKVVVKNYYPLVSSEEAKNLLLQALEWNEQREKQDKILQAMRPAAENIPNKTNTNTKTAPGEYKKVSIPNPSEDIFPPCIKLLLNGVKSDGRKRALFVLINFFKALGVPDSEIERRLNEWNDKNYSPLKRGYIQSQLNWYKKNTSMMPPNCDKPSYKDLTVCKPDELCKQIKNPVNYATRKYFAMNRGRS